MATTKITNPELFDLASLDTALQLPSGTTAQRPTSPSTGEWRYNTDDNKIEFYDGADWLTIQDEHLPPVPSENFSAITYTGTVASTSTATQSITGLGFQPDVVWIKQRNSTAWHHLTDSSRGGTPNKSVLFTNTADAEGTGTQNYGGVVSYDSDGFTLQGGPLGSNNVCELGSTYVAWCWKLNGGTTSSNTDGSITSTVQASSKNGISIIEYTGNGSSGATIGHGLSVAPELLLFKRLNASESWNAWASDFSSYVGFLNTSDAFISYSVLNTSTSTITLNNGTGHNASGSPYVCYAFASVAGYSKINSYTGNGSTQLIETGFEPAFVLIKTIIGGAGDWRLYDNKRGSTDSSSSYIGNRKPLYGNLNIAEGNGINEIRFLSNGFEVGPGNNTNTNGIQFIYMAFAADPSTSTPTLADSFNESTYSGSGTTKTIQGLGFKPEFIWMKRRSSIQEHALVNVVSGILKHFNSDLTAAETTTTNGVSSFDNDGWTMGGNGLMNSGGQTYVGWAWKANPIPTINTDGTIQSIVSANPAAGFSIVKYTGNGSASQSVGHGLNSAPELIIAKANIVSSWVVYTATTGTDKFLELNSSAAEQTSSNYWGTSSPTATTFGVAPSNSNNNSSGNSVLAYCFHSVSGFSSIGSYAGDSTSGRLINTGFQADWVMIKTTNATSNWFIIDSKRGGLNDLRPNSSSAEQTRAAGLTFVSNGFEIDDTTLGFNSTGTNYIYAAFKINETARDLDFLVIAGGAAGGVDDRGAGGGGAGGFRTSYGTASGGGSTPESGLVLTAGTYTITVGAGGAGVTGHPQISNNGSDSSIVHTSASLISTGGGAGGWGNSASGSNYGGFDGGSGGGAAHGATSDSNKSSGITGQGYGGGKGLDSGTDFCGGGGGGASAVGADGTASSGGNGGNGLAATISGSSITYAGGGGGGAQGAPAGSGGTGGGGAGSVNKNDATDGTTNTGSGGGGRGSTGSAPYSGYSGSGGSGIVVLRMPTASYSGTTTGSPTVTTDGSDTILTYTGSGTYVHS